MAQIHSFGLNYYNHPSSFYLQNDYHLCFNGFPNYPYQQDQRGKVFFVDFCLDLNFKYFQVMVSINFQFLILMIIINPDC